MVRDVCLAHREPWPSDLARIFQTVAEFIASQPALDRQRLLTAAQACGVATESTAAHTSTGHTYWSADVASITTTAARASSIANAPSTTRPSWSV